jgi:hypothetical protein
MEKDKITKDSVELVSENQVHPKKDALSTDDDESV